MDSLEGLTVGTFQIIELIGRGGMSSVYLAADKELERSVALKVPHSKFVDDPDFVKRFRREAKAMARLRHPNIVQIYSVGTHGYIPFFAMEYIHGESLSQMLKKNGPLETDVALSYITQVAHAVEYAHKMDVIHRDIKPANILVDSSGRVLVTDFGVSKLLDETSQETIGFMGTPQYMSPEQCGEGVLDHRCDIYSLGAVFFEMLTGTPPFCGDSPAETIKKQLFDLPEFPEQFKRKIPERIQSIVSKMLAKAPEQRYPSIPEFLRELGNLDRECGKSTFAESVKDSERQRTSNGAKETQDFISHVNGHRPRWPKLVLISLVAICAIAFSTSFVLSNGLKFHISATSSPSSQAEGPKPPPSEHALEAQPESVEQPVDGPEEEPVNQSLKTSERAKAMAAGSEAEVTQEVKSAKLQVNSKPIKAEVLLDSELRGKTPLVLSALSLGKYQLALKLEGYPDYIEEISLDTPESLEVFHDFVAARQALIPKSSLSIDSDPPGATVYIDGEKKGKTPLEVPELRPASYAVELRLEGYYNLQRKMTLKPDENLRISLNLAEKPKFGDLSFGSQPNGAQVLLNGAYKGNTPLILRRIPVGTYEVVMRKEGYEPVRQELACKNNVIRRLEAQLKMTPEFAALQSVSAGDSFAKAGDFASAISAYEEAVSLDPQAPAYSEKLKYAKRSLLVKEVHGVLASYKAACESENKELLVSLLDDNNSDFQTEQRLNAEKLFREFDNITITLSNAKIQPRDHDEVLVNLHLGISASFAETGHLIVLLNSDKLFTLRRNAEDTWKICTIE